MLIVNKQLVCLGQVVIIAGWGVVCCICRRPSQIHAPPRCKPQFILDHSLTLYTKLLFSVSSFQYCFPCVPKVILESNKTYKNYRNKFNSLDVFDVAMEKKLRKNSWYTHLNLYTVLSEQLPVTPIIWIALDMIRLGRKQTHPNNTSFIGATLFAKNRGTFVQRFIGTVFLSVSTDWCFAVGQWPLKTFTKLFSVIIINLFKNLSCKILSIIV